MGYGFCSALPHGYLNFSCLSVNRTGVDKTGSLCSGRDLAGSGHGSDGIVAA